MPTLTRTAALASTMRVSVMRLARRLRSERAGHGLSLTQIATLATLDRHGPLTPRELADREMVQPPSMTRILAGLEE
jgi:DNA-binding MarR family transcriptional regulator